MKFAIEMHFKEEKIRTNHSRFELIFFGSLRHNYRFLFQHVILFFFLLPSQQTTGVKMESRQHRNLEWYTLLWCEENLQLTDEIQRTLRQSINYVKAFSTIDQCREYLQTHITESLLDEDERIILVISLDYLDQLMLQVHQLKQIIAVYIFATTNADERELSSMKFDKVGTD